MTRHHTSIRGYDTDADISIDPFTNPPSWVKRLAIALIKSAHEDAMFAKLERNKEFRPESFRNRLPSHRERTQQKKAIDWLLADPDEICTEQKIRPIETIGLTVLFACQAAELDVQAAQEAVKKQHVRIKKKYPPEDFDADDNVIVINKSK